MGLVMIPDQMRSIEWGCGARIRKYGKYYTPCTTSCHPEAAQRDPTVLIQCNLVPRSREHSYGSEMQCEDRLLASEILVIMVICTAQHLVTKGIYITAALLSALFC